MQAILIDCKITYGTAQKRRQLMYVSKIFRIHKVMTRSAYGFSETRSIISIAIEAGGMLNDQFTNKITFEN